MEKKPILKLNRLKKYFRIRSNVNLKALEDISVTLYEGEKFGVVGESGCGKSTLGRVILQLYPQTSGSCVYFGKPIAELSPKYMMKEIDHLLKYQSKASEYYQKALEAEKKAKEIEAKADTLTIDGSKKEEAKKSKLLYKVEKYYFDAKEFKKDASRQLREGSKTVGSLITIKDLPKVQALFKEAYNNNLKAQEYLNEANKNEAERIEKISKNINAKTNEDEKQKAYNQYLACKEKAKLLREEAFKMRGKDVLDITERCQDEAYLTKLDNNFETGINMCKLTHSELTSLRKDMQMIFQDPSASLDPRQTVGKAIEEVFIIHTKFSVVQRKQKAIELLEKVGLKEEQYYSYPHQLSGGQKQRVGIARAIALNPKFIVLDESVSALDVSVQAQILQLLNELQESYGLTYFFITHNLGVVKHFCDRVMVMYLGGMCELSTSESLFNEPLHPYTLSLLQAVPRPHVKDGGMDETVIEGEVPSAINPPSGCTFHTRCSKCMDICKKEKPLPKEAKPGHFVSCHLF